MEYSKFLENKRIIHQSTGLDVDRDALGPFLFPFQRDITHWALRKGKAAIFAGCGLGKTPMQLEWSRQVNNATGGDILIVAPLAVSQQTVREGNKFGISVNICKHRSDVKPGINITNYERLDNFNPDAFVGVVLDESSILKAQAGKTRTQIINMFEGTPYKLSATATAAPNDYTELGNQAEFLGICTANEMFAMFFTHDSGDTSKWRLKGHAQKRFWEWVASWAVMLEKPSDLGYSDEGFELPPLHIHQVTVESPKSTDSLFVTEAQTLDERRKARKDSIAQRVQTCAEMVSNSDEPWLVWCDLNDESDALTKAIDGAVEVRGSNTPEYKEATALKFANGEIDRLVSKPSIFGWGLNWQHCSNMAFVGLSDSFEQLYQAIRRCWRFGQTNPVNVYVITSEAEGAVVANIQRKESEFKAMLEGMISATQEITKANIQSTQREYAEYKEAEEHGKGWTAYLGDSCLRIREIPDNSIHYSIFSPPFASLYTYSNSNHDMGNSRSDDEFYEHFKFLVDELYRITMPGRLLSFHCMNLPSSKQYHGYIGIRDFRGELIKLFVDAGWIYHSEVCIWKDPVVAMQRTKALGLLHKQIKKDSCMSRQGIADYVVTMRKPGENPERVTHTNDSFPVSVWQRYASPVWMDIQQGDTLNKLPARESEDERHIAPLQLGVIERCIELWTNPGDIVFTPFMGIASEMYQAIKMGRRAMGIELKESYFKVGVNNCRSAEQMAEQETLFGGDAF